MLSFTGILLLAAMLTGGFLIVGGIVRAFIIADAKLNMILAEADEIVKRS